MPESGVSERGDRMPWWARLWMLVPVADRWAHVRYWRRGGFDVEPAPDFEVPDGGWSTPPPGGWVRVRRHRWWGWDVITNTHGNWLAFAAPGAAIGGATAWALGTAPWQGAVIGGLLTLLAVAITVAVQRRAAARRPMTMGFGDMDGDDARALVERLQTEGIAAAVAEPIGPRSWRIEVEPRHEDRALAIAGELGLV